MCWKKYSKVRTFNKKKWIYQDIRREKNWARFFAICLIIIIISAAVLIII